MGQESAWYKLAEAASETGEITHLNKTLTVRCLPGLLTVITAPDDADVAFLESLSRAVHGSIKGGVLIVAESIRFVKLEKMTDAEVKAQFGSKGFSSE